MWENRSRILFLSGVLIAGFVFFQMGMYLLYGLMGWQLRFNFFQLCSMTIRSMGLGPVIYLFNGLIVYTFLLAISMTLHQLWLTNRFSAKLSLCEQREETARINRLFGEGKNEFVVVKQQEPFAFTYGFIHPQIVLSTGLLQLLDEQELSAVIHHEAFHRKHADPLKTFLMSLFAKVFWFIPVLKHLDAHYKIIREVLADHYAMDHAGGTIPLGSALLKLLKKGQFIPAHAAVHVSIGGASINLRIQRILDPKTTIPFVLPTTSVVISLSTVLVFVQVFLVAMT